MSASEYTHVIPPYLLGTCVGQEHLQQLRWLDAELAARNSFSPDTSNYRYRRPRDLEPVANSFCDDTSVNELISQKLKEKFAVMGLLGGSPPEHISDEYLFELYETFKDRLLPENGDTQILSIDDNNGVQRVVASSSVQSSSTPAASGSALSESQAKQKHSVFDVPRYGEFLYTSSGKGLGDGDLESCHLDALIAWAQDTKEHKYSFRPYLMTGNSKFFLTSLPMYWTPLAADQSFSELTNKYGLDSDITDGHSVLSLKLSKTTASSADNLDDKRFYNFISDSEIHGSTGIFYYEVQVKQTATSSTNFEPLIKTNDPSISSASSLFFNMGFTKRSIKVDKVPPPPGPSAINLIDLKDTQRELSRYNLKPSGTKLDDNTIALLNCEPGISFDGSIAISFNNACSYAAIKKSVGGSRASSLNLNRRFLQLNRHTSADQETSKLDLDVPFQTHSSPRNEGKKEFHTDVVGFGVNFIERSLFITLNGVMVKTIYEQDITSSNKYQDSIFGLGTESEPLFPLIGFRMTNLETFAGTNDPPEAKIITNFGLRRFEFNIDNYVREFKSTQKTELQTVVADEIKNINPEGSGADHIAKFEESLREIPDNPAVLNEFIEGYLVQEGFMGTLESFKSDLESLAKNANRLEDDDMEGQENAHSLWKLSMQTKALPRIEIKRSILDGKFMEAIEILRQQFPTLEKLQEFTLELELSEYIELLRNYLTQKFRVSGGISGDSESSQNDLFEKSYSHGKQLMQRFGPSSSIPFAELSSSLLVDTEEQLKKLPQACRLFERHANDTKVLADMINSAILESRGFSKTSRLEGMVTGVKENVTKLGLESRNPFRLINFDDDFMEV